MGYLSAKEVLVDRELLACRADVDADDVAVQASVIRK